MNPATLFAIAISTVAPSDSHRMAARIEPEPPAIVRHFENEEDDRRHIHVDIKFDDPQSTWK